MDVTLVIPIYQVEKYIKDCIQSVINQTYKEFTVILVNDGSLDKSIAIAEHMLCDAYIKYTVIHKENGGLPSARNCGLYEAQTKWVINIDSDDVIHPEFVATLVDVAEKYKSDIAFCDFQEVNTNLWQPPTYDNGVVEYTREQFQEQYIRRSIIPVVASMIIRTNWMKTAGLFLDEDCRFGGDQHYIWKLSFYADRVTHIRKPLYNYRLRPDSIITSPNIEKVKSNCDCMKKLGNEMKEKFPHNKVARYIRPRCLMATLNTVAKYSTYSEFAEVAAYAGAKQNMQILYRFPDFRVRLMSRVYAVDERLYYSIIHRVLGK